MTDGAIPAEPGGCDRAESTMEPPTPAVIIREMRDRDTGAVARLEAASFTSPWSEETFHTLLGRSGVVLRVGEVGDMVVAYAVLWCVMDQGELANIAVHPEHRGRGIGGHLLDHLLDEARVRGVRSLFLEVRESNEAAREMYRRRGFEQVGIRRGYYDRPPEDACVLRVELP